MRACARRSIASPPRAELDEIEVELVEISRCFDVIAAARRAQAE
jgi:hypothetical protein